MISFWCSVRESIHSRSPWLAVIMIAASLSLTACEESSSSSDVPAEESLSTKTEFETEDLEHLLTRAEFGVTSASLSELEAMGVEAYVDEMIAQTATASPSLTATAALDEISDPDFPSTNELVQYWSNLLVYSENPFLENLAFFWHDHFAVAQDVLGGNAKYWMLDHIEMLRTHANGNLRDFLLAVSTDWAMLEWLDGVESKLGAPNENFAREFWELFTLGVDNGYTQEDIVEASRVFTGYRVRNNPDTGQDYVEYDPNRHDEFSKVIFGLPFTGRSGENSNLEYLDMVNFTLDNRPVAEFICEKLFKHFCHDEPSEAVINELADVMVNNDYEIKPVLKKILLSEAFYSEKSKEGFIKSPIEFAVGFIRTTGLVIPMGTMRNRLNDLTQTPSLPPGVEGWPTGELWLGTQGMVERANLLRECVNQRNFQTNADVDLEAILPEDRSDTSVVDHLAELLRVDLSSEERDLMIEYLNHDMNNARVVIEDPFDGTNANQIDKKVRGLLYILAQHPSYQVR